MHQPWILSWRIGEESCDGSRKNNTLEVHVYQVECCREESCDTLSIVAKNCAIRRCCYGESCDTLEAIVKNRAVPWMLSRRAVRYLEFCTKNRATALEQIINWKYNKGIWLPWMLLRKIFARLVRRKVSSLAGVRSQTLGVAAKNPAVGLGKINN